MAAFGRQVPPSLPDETLVTARGRAALLPDLLVDARRIANNVTAGWHGRRQRGIGENFWQFRPYVDGEGTARIDWRRSAREDHLFIRDKEWEAAHTVWLWADDTPSMLYKSRLASVSKQERALIIVLALAELLSRSGERIGWPGMTHPFTSRNGAERIAMRLAQIGQAASLPDFSAIKRYSDIVIASDFLDLPDITKARLNPLVERGVRAHLVEIVDPAEEEFPFAGRTEFHDPESGETLTAGRAETMAADYRNLYLARRAELSEWCKRQGWSFTTSHTDHQASEALAAIHMALSTDRASVSAGGR